MGDFNIDYTKTKDPSTRKLLSAKNSFSFDQVIDKPTSFTAGKNSLLDLMFTNIKHVTFAGVYIINMSDHLPTMLIYKKNREEKNTLSIRCRSYSEENNKKFKEEIGEIDWTHLEESDDVNTIWLKMYTAFITILDKCCPFHIFKVKRDKPVYISDEIIQLGKDRDRAFKLARTSNKAEDFKLARTLRQRVNYAVRNAKRKFILENLINSKGDSRKFWDNIKVLLPKKQSPEIKTVINKKKQGNRGS